MPAKASALSRTSRTRCTSATPARYHTPHRPTRREHREILTGLLGYSASEVDELARSERFSSRRFILYRRPGLRAGTIPCDLSVRDNWLQLASTFGACGYGSRLGGRDDVKCDARRAPQKSSYPRKRVPVRRGFSVLSSASLEYWVARSSRAMTAGHSSAISPRVFRARFARDVRPSQSEGAGNAGARCARSLVGRKG